MLGRIVLVLFELHDRAQGKTQMSECHHISDRGIILPEATDKGLGLAAEIDADACKCVGFAAFAQAASAVVLEICAGSLFPRLVLSCIDADRNEK